MIDRQLKNLIIQSKKSILLLGPRQTGKSTLLKSLNPDLIFNLADEETYITFASNPGELKSRLALIPKNKTPTIFVDEVQRIPSILNTIQSIIDHNHDIKFLLSGSSARKLKRGKANLLPGRLHTFNLGTIISNEVSYNFNTEELLSYGALPGIVTDADKLQSKKTLKSYAATYLKEEIQAEGLSRNLEGFARFLKVVSSWTSTLIDYSKVASLSMVSRQSATRYFDILEDTLIFNRLLPFSKGTRLKLIQHPKLYIFDVGVLNGLLDNFIVSDDRIGVLFETLVLSQLLSSISAYDKTARVSFYLTEAGAEVDFILELDGNVFCIEVKSNKNLTGIDLRGFESFQKFYGKKCEKLVFYRGNVEKELNGVKVLPWQYGLKYLGL
jgi:predicted AAA+ superfamily ATPase